MGSIPIDRFGLLLVISAVLMSGCAGSRAAIERDVPEAFPGHSVDQILSNIRASGPGLHAFEARASLAIKSPENSGQFSAEMRERRGDSLYVSISPGLGIEAARALVTPDSFFFYDRIKNRVVSGALDDASAILPDPFTSENLFDNLLGMIAPPAGTRWEVSSDPDFYYLTDGIGRQTYVVDPAFWRVVRFEEHDASGTLIESRSFSEFDEFEGVIIPRRLEFRRPQEDRMASIYYRSMDLNPGELSFDLRVRDSAERVEAGK